MDMAEQENSKREGRPQDAIPVLWKTVDSISTVFANELIIVHTKNNFYIVFGEAFPMPIVEEEIDGPFISVQPVAKIALSPDSMKAFLEVMKSNVGRYTEKHES